MKRRRRYRYRSHYDEPLRKGQRVTVLGGSEVGRSGKISYFSTGKDGNHFVAVHFSLPKQGFLSQLFEGKRMGDSKIVFIRPDDLKRA